MDKKNSIAVLDFGGQYAHLFANRIRRLGVFSHLVPHDSNPEDLSEYAGLILSGGPQSVNADDSLQVNPGIFDSGIPVLGVCYGHQVINVSQGGKVEHGATKEYGHTKVKISKAQGVFEGLPDEINVWMSHWDEVTEISGDFEVIGSTDVNQFTAVANFEKHLYALQFHPEVTHTEFGMKIIENFVNITGAERSWDAGKYLEMITGEVKEHFRKSKRKVFMLVSGGVDSLVGFTLLNQILGRDNVYGMLVDTGTMRKGEVREVMETVKELEFDNLHVYDAADEFLGALAGVSEPEEKRKIIGDKFLEVQGRAVMELGLNPEEWMLGQGTIYPDTIESAGTQHADLIKTHHNRVPQVQELIDKGLVIEPLTDLYKDEVRMLGEKIGLPHNLVWRHPFPGPGLAIRMLCTSSAWQITKDRESQHENLLNIEVIEKLRDDFGFEGKVLDLKSVGVQGDARTYRHPLLIWRSKSEKQEVKSEEDYGRVLDLVWNDGLISSDGVAVRMTNEFAMINRVIISLNGCIDSVELMKEKYVTVERASLLQEADKIVMNAIMSEERCKDIWQCPTVLLPVDVNGSGKESILIRPISSQEAMTASVFLIPHDILSTIVVQLSELDISGIFYDLTSKPPGTIEWE